VPEPRWPEEVFVSHVSHFKDGFVSDLLSDRKVGSPYLNLGF